MNGHKIYLANEFEKILNEVGLKDKFMFHLVEDGQDPDTFFKETKEEDWITQAFTWPSYSVWPSVNEVWTKFLDSRPLQQKVVYEEVCNSNAVALDNIHNDISEIRFRLSAIKKKLDEIEGWLGV